MYVVIIQVKLLIRDGLNQDEVCVLSYYQKQVSRIRHLLRNERLGQVNIIPSPPPIILIMMM